MSQLAMLGVEGYTRWPLVNPSILNYIMILHTILHLLKPGWIALIFIDENWMIWLFLNYWDSHVEAQS